MSTKYGSFESVESTSGNHLDFIPFLSVIPFEWRAIGDAFKSASKIKSGIKSSLAGRCTFVVRQGYDPTDQSSTGRVLEGNGDFGICLRSKTGAISLTASNLSLRTGLDDPLVGAANFAPPSLKATLAHEFSEDSFIAASYDLKLRKPELSLCWTGETFTEKATFSLTADPVHRALKLSAAVSFPGTEWRNTVYDEENDVIEEPKDDGARHSLWVRHEARQRDLLHRTSLGARIDMGRLVNWVVDVIDYKLEPHFPRLFWALPGSQTLYNFLVPAEDENQVRHHIRGWDLDTSYEFGRSGPLVSVSKSLRHATLSLGWDAHEREAGLEYAIRGLRLGAKLGRDEAGSGIWKRPSLYAHIEPLELL
ncbi:hypothetical protein CEUSTIGMA_g5858.t1 [Chlamydomonas eustigma]|uniref:Bacterial surface antigen (D15) domain-containing protein n=1 Tax=Chlamydomonas eustigma TaxID=1157962 RepID=A0A250X5U8_9CHLO|nr:hypothetical protein CEUSTIGMA_g5858.t1 [Chlamydomonas eustigma]|eukprot:GAX78416.1 hypothetical protein CEUSTIGMA_g5858.t1 [Chlamydomonas eustigma]